MKLEVLKCVCFKETSEPGGEGRYDGMPHLQTTPDMNCWEAYCPNCGRGGIIEYKSPYLALKSWNVMQEGLRSPYSALFYDDEKEKQDD